MPGFQEFVVIALVALIVLGPNRLPTVARQLGRLLVRLRAEARQTVSALREEGSLGELEDELRQLRRELRDTQGLASRTARDAIMGDAPAHRTDETSGAPPGGDPEGSMMRSIDPAPDTAAEGRGATADGSIVPSAEGHRPVPSDEGELPSTEVAPLRPERFRP